jgi:hypothetical protein
MMHQSVMSVSARGWGARVEKISPLGSRRLDLPDFLGQNLVVSFFISQNVFEQHFEGFVLRREDLLLE